MQHFVKHFADNHQNADNDGRQQKTVQNERRKIGISKQWNNKRTKGKQRNEKRQTERVVITVDFLIILRGCRQLIVVGQQGRRTGFFRRGIGNNDVVPQNALGNKNDAKGLNRRGHSHHISQKLNRVIVNGNDVYQKRHNANHGNAEIKSGGQSFGLAVIDIDQTPFFVIRGKNHPRNRASHNHIERIIQKAFQ